jgi:hypothetical protein
MFFFVLFFVTYHSSFQKKKKKKKYAPTEVAQPIGMPERRELAQKLVDPIEFDAAKNDGIYCFVMLCAHDF